MIGFYLFERVEDFFSLGKDGVDRVHENVALVVQRFWKKLNMQAGQGFGSGSGVFF